VPFWGYIQRGSRPESDSGRLNIHCRIFPVLDSLILAITHLIHNLPKSPGSQGYISIPTTILAIITIVISGGTVVPFSPPQFLAMLYFLGQVSSFLLSRKIIEPSPLSLRIGLGTIADQFSPSWQWS
jgi:hypothetical protein